MIRCKKLLLSSAIVCAMLGTLPAHAQTRRFDIPAQPVASAIPELARQARMQIVAPARGLKGRNAPAIVGEMDVREALDRLLQGSGLVIASNDGQIILLQAADDAIGNATGSIGGRVYDPVTGEFLTNAIIRISSSKGRQTIVAGERGEFALSQVSAGPVEMTVEFTGYTTRVIKFELAADEDVVQDIELRSSGKGAGVGATELNAIRVVGVREGDARALMEQRASMNITNSLSAESYGEISEGNPGEFLKFMPGVDTDGVGDGTVRTVQLRGLPPAYTSVTLNGVNLAAADANTGADASRTFSFEQMSLSNLDSIEVSKTISADVDANAPAGTINLKTKRAFDRKGRRIGAQVSGSTHSNMWDSSERSGPQEGGYGSTKFLPNGQLDYSDVFFNKRLGIAASVSESNLYVEQEQITASRNYVPTALSPEPLAITAINPQVGAREIMRSAASFNVDFKATDSLILSMATIFNKSGIAQQLTDYTFTSGARTRGVIGNPMTDFDTRQLATTNTLAVTNSVTYKDGRGRVFVPSFEYNNEHIKLEGNLSWSNSVSQYNPRGELGAANTMSSLTARGNFSASRGNTLLGQPWQINQLSGVDWSDPAAFSAANPLILRANSNPRAEHTLGGGALNLTFDRTFGDTLVVFKTGAKVSRAEFDYSDRNDEDRYRYVGPLSQTQLLTQIRSQSQASFADSGMYVHSLSGGDIYMPSMYRLLDFWRRNPQDWEKTSTTSPSEWYGINVGNNRNFREEMRALYFMATADLGQNWKLRAGLRWEQTNTRAREADGLSAEEMRAAGYAVNSATGLATTVDGMKYQFTTRPWLTRRGKYDNFFPSASLKYSFSDSLDLQFGYSRTIRRPEVGVLTGVWSINEVDRVVSAPNPGLQPELSDNLSVRLAKYYEPVGMLAVNYYQNRVKGLFQSQEMTAAEFGYTGTEYADYIFKTTERVSGEAINIRGYELEFNHAMDYLPGALNGLSVRGSFMWNKPDVPIIRSADKMGSLSLSYQKGRASLFLNTVWTADKYRSTTPSWFDEYWDTNLSGRFEIVKGWEAFFSVRNLLDRNRNVVVPGALATTGALSDHSAIYIHGGRNATLGLRARF